MSDLALPVSTPVAPAEDAAPSPERRLVQGAAIEAIDVDEARAHMRAADAARTGYVRRLYRVDPANASLYHLVIDSTVLALDDVVEMIASAATRAQSAIGGTPGPRVAQA